MDNLLPNDRQASSRLLLGKNPLWQARIEPSYWGYVRCIYSHGHFYKVSGWKATLGCNNLRALILSLKERQRIKPNAACLDIHRSLRSTKNKFTGSFKYQHVAGHMDNFLLWHQLSLIQQLNCVCDTTAKGAVHSAVAQGFISAPTHQVLPQEDIAIIIWGNKITNNISHPI